jgi:hypothetical protein
MGPTMRRGSLSVYAHFGIHPRVYLLESPGCIISYRKSPGEQRQGRDSGGCLWNIPLIPPGVSIILDSSDGTPMPMASRDTDGLSRHRWPLETDGRRDTKVRAGDTRSETLRTLASLEVA